LREASLAQLINGAQEARHQLFALSASAVLFQQQVAEPLLETVNGLQYRMLGQIGG
jgi:hypothetical protein